MYTMCSNIFWLLRLVEQTLLWAGFRHLPDVQLPRGLHIQVSTYFMKKY